jgi:signal peptidase II
MTQAGPEEQRRHLALAVFAGLAAFIVVGDQILKQWVLASFEPYKIYPVIGDWLQIDFIHNAGGLFGFLQGTALIFAAVTIVVAVLIAILEFRWGWHSWLTTLALGLLLGGAIGNLIDRIRFGYVVDFVDIGIGSWRWYIFNVADMAVTCFFLVLIATWIFWPRILGTDSKEAKPDAGGPEAK